MPLRTTALGGLLLTACLGSHSASVMQDAGPQDADPEACPGDLDPCLCPSTPCAAAGDGDGDGFPVPDPDTVSPWQLCERLATAQCAGEAFCCDNVTRTRSDCKATMLEGCTRELMLDAAAARPVTGFDAAHAAEAFAEFEKMAAACDPEIARYGVSLAGFAGMMKGTLPPGADCTPQNLPDRIEQIVYLLSCNARPTHACSPFGGGPWTCNPRGGVGSECVWDLNCQEGLFCDNPQVSPLGGTWCQPIKQDGEACTAPNNCASLTCRDGICLPATVQTAYCLQQ